MNEQSQSHQDVAGRRIKQEFVLFAIIGGFFIVAEHRAHLIPYLPWLFLAACPLMHVFMHHGHGGHGSGDEVDRQRSAASGPGQAASPGRGYGIQLRGILRLPNETVAGLTQTCGTVLCHQRETGPLQRRAVQLAL
jgi:Protein of unknown function (DUF2933)